MAFTYNNPRLGVVDLTTVATTLGQPGVGNLPAVTLESQFAEIVSGWDGNLGGGEFMYARCATTVVAAQTISSITITGGVATLTTAAAHGLVVGQVVQISGATPIAYNGNQIVTSVPSSTTFTFASSATANATVVGSYVAGIGAGMVCEFAYSLFNGAMIVTATPWVGTANTGKPVGVSMAAVFPGQSSWYQVQGNAVVSFNGTATVGSPVYWQSNGTLSNTVVASKQVIGAVSSGAAGAVIGQGNAAVTLPAYQAVVMLSRPVAQGAIT